MGVRSDQTPAEIITVLTRSLVAAINARDFESKVWDNISPSVRSYSQRLTGLRESLSGKQAFIESMRALAQECPDWKIQLQDFTVHIDSAANYAEVFVLSHTSGEPSGIARAVLTRIEWRLIKGKWLFVTHEIIPGLEM